MNMYLFIYIPFTYNLFMYVQMTSLINKAAVIQRICILSILISINTILSTDYLHLLYSVYYTIIIYNIVRKVTSVVKL